MGESPLGKIQTPRRPWGPVVAVLVCVGCLAPFANKAFTIDDPLFLWAAQHIQQHPGDPYGFTVNWYGWPQQMAENTKNPPLMAYFLAAAAALVGWSETALHLVCLLPAAGLAWGIYRLAEDLCTRPLSASLLAILTPVFLVSSTNVMCDTLMVCLWVWAVLCWRRGLARPGWLFVAAVLITLCALTKYFGVSLIPLLLVYTLAVCPRFGPRRWIPTLSLALVAMLIPVAVLCAYEWLSQRLYDRGLLGDAVGFSVGWRSDWAERSWGPLIGLIFTGGCLAGVLFYLPLLWSRRTLGAGVVVAVTLLVPVLAMGRLSWYPLFADTLTQQVRSAGTVWCLAAQTQSGQGPASYALAVAETARPTSGPQGLDVPAVLHMAVFVVIGLGVVALAVADLWRHRDANALLLFLWAAGTWLFAVEVNWVVNGRSLLPLAPVVGILVARRLDLRRGPSAAWAWREAWPLAGAAALGLAVTYADYRQAEADRSAAHTIARRCGGQSGKLWLEGHWGFQYYLEQQGAVHFDCKAIMDRTTLAVNTWSLTAHSQFRQSFAAGPAPYLLCVAETAITADSNAYHPRPGDLLVVPRNNYGIYYEPAPWQVRPVLTLEAPCLPWLTTHHLVQGAGFYSHDIGPFPFLIGPCEPIQYQVVQVLVEVLPD
jgi:4-amino-4-deoxy-L-arabinose transferase-like glycosyltransferase